MKENRKYFIIISVISLTALFSQAQEKIRIPISVRSIGMGGVHAAVFDEISTFFYNPAGMSFLSEVEESGVITRQMTNAGHNKSFAENMSEINKYDDYFNNWFILSQEEKDKFLSIPSLFGNVMCDFAVVIPGEAFAIGVGGYSSGDMRIHVEPQMYPLPPSLNTTMINDVNLKVGASKNLGPLSLGIAVNEIYRNKLDFGTDISDIIELLGHLFTGGESTTSLFMEGRGTGLDMGATYKLPSLSVGLVLRNIVSSEIKWNDNSTSNLEMEIDCGVFWRSEENLRIGADISDITSDVDMSEKLHLGLEYIINPASIRAGYNQGGITFGIEILGLEYSYAEKYGMPGSPITDNWQYFGYNVEIHF